LFLQINRNKLGITLDPMHPDGQEIVRKLVETADIVVANLPPQTLTAMQLDYDSLKAVKSDIILTTVSAYGRGGPYSNRVGFDGIGQAMSGAVYMTGEEDQPYRAQVPWVDFSTALHCAFGTMAALMARKQTGKGQWVEGALLATAVTLGNALLIEQAVIKPDRVPTKNRGQTSAPVDIFRTKDGWILVQVVGNPLFKRWAKLMGEDHWLTDPRFKDDISRGDNGAVISERMSRWCADRLSAEALEILAEAKIPSGPILKPQQTLDDPHINAMGFFQPTEFPGMPGLAPIAKVPVWLSDTPGSIRRRAPMLGEHTDQILAELGYTRKAIAGLRERKII
jgi:crotonobetainyl-CoA:carnitine CoA-transferase CaiB-like acyl-CoA transferase